MFVPSPFRLTEKKEELSMNSSVQIAEEADWLLGQAIGKMFALKLATGATPKSLREFAIGCVADAVKGQRQRGRMLRPSKRS
jgi:hypothetical protein